MVISHKYSDKIVYEIKQCYMQIYLEDQVSEVDNWFVQAITVAVQNGNAALHEKFAKNPYVSFSTDEDGVVFQSFSKQIGNLLCDVTEWVYDYHQVFGYSIDIVGIMLPYVLEKIGITYSEVGVFVPLALLIVQMAVDNVVHQKNIIQEKKKERAFRKFMQKNLDVLSRVRSDNEEVQNAITEAKKANEKLLSLLTEGR